VLGNLSVKANSVMAMENTLSLDNASRPVSLSGMEETAAGHREISS
jgi:hypothetical protein